MCKKIIFRGRVQKVGFRYFAADIAQKLNLSGYVRNLADGSVEAVVVGKAEAIESFIYQCANNHPIAVVSHWNVEDWHDCNYSDFSIKRD